MKERERARRIVRRGVERVKNVVGGGESTVLLMLR